MIEDNSVLERVSEQSEREASKPYITLSSGVAVCICVSTNGTD